jgi:CxxC motif-containing protein (DUF1111 family)
MRTSRGRGWQPRFTTCGPWIIFGLALLLTGSAIAVAPSKFGDPLSGLTKDEKDLFSEGREDFMEEEKPEDGLGPVFNDVSCAACHSNPVVGGDSNVLETRFGRIKKQQFDAMSEFGGSLIQSQGIGDCLGKNNGEKVPPQATIVAQRKTTPLFGLGLVDNVPDSVLDGIAEDQKAKYPDVAGTANKVTDVASGTPNRTGRFGWKAQVATLLTFSGDAYLNEMGITNPLFPTENAPQGDAKLLAKCDKVDDPEDDGTGVHHFNNFMTLLAPPPRGPITPEVTAGEVVFQDLGCAICHHPTLTTGPSSVAALNQVIFQPFSDFLLHDMGSLGDGITQGGATGSQMRTAPLWGLSVRTTFLHDGRASNLPDAILAHDGQGLTAQNLYRQLKSSELAKLIAFLKSL